METQIEKSISRYNIQEINTAPKIFFGKKEEVKIDEMSSYFNRQMPQLMQVVAQAGLLMKGAPCGIYFDMDERSKITKMAIAIPVKEVKDPKIKDYEFIKVPAGKALVADYYGAYDNIPDVHHSMMEFLNKKGLKETLVIEEYLSDPNKEPDPNKWLTKVYYML